MPITNTTRIIDLPTKSSLGSGDYFAVDNENGDTSKILASSVSGSSTAGLVAKEYSNAQTYGDGAIRIHVDNNVPNLYKSNQDIQSPEAWTPAHWDSTDAGEEIEAANAAIASLNQSLAELQNNRIGSYVSLNTYTTFANAFVAPSDGYITATSGGTLGDLIMVDVENKVHISSRCDATNYTVYTTLFIRKGMRVHVNTNTGNRGRSYFYPIVEP